MNSPEVFQMTCGQSFYICPTQRSNECACSSHARAILARVGMGCTISIETSKRQNGGRFKFRGIGFQLAGIRWRQNS